MSSIGRPSARRLHVSWDRSPFPYDMGRGVRAALLGRYPAIRRALQPEVRGSRLAQVRPKTSPSTCSSRSLLRCSNSNTGSRGCRHLKAEQSTIFGAVARGFLFSGGRKKQKQNKGPWGPNSSGHCGIHMPDTWPHTTPHPQAAFARAPAGRVAIAGAVGYPKGTTTAPNRRRLALATTAAPCPDHGR